MSEWQSIASAPKDGRHMILWAKVPETPYLLYADPVIISGYWDAMDEAWCATTSTFAGPFLDATHWMPLPAPPVQS